jgi:hypothetical protein
MEPLANGGIAMATTLLRLLCICVLLLSSVSCKKLETSNKNSGPLSMEPSKFTDAIPEEYGALIGVTQNPQSPGWVGLWFQKPDKTITGVFVNVEQGKIFEKTLTIPRK